MEQKQKSKEVIEGITKVTNLILPLISSNREFCGYKIKTNLRTLYLIVNSYKQCCESFGYSCVSEGVIITEDDIETFLQADLIDLDVSTENNQIKSLLKERFGLYETIYAVFIDVKTSKGVLQFTLYNSHNGWYGHEAYIYDTSKELDSVGYRI